MKMRFLKSAFLGIVFVLSVTLVSAAQTQQLKPSSPTIDTPQVLADKREIIKILLTDFFGENKQTIYLSTKNVPFQIQNEFPQIKDLTARFSNYSDEKICAFEFHSFVIRGKIAQVDFGGCNDGLNYNLTKSNGKWKINTLITEK
jgi:hypothetical protein